MIKIDNVYGSKPAIILGKVGVCGCKIFLNETDVSLIERFGVDNEKIESVVKAFESESSKNLREEYPTDKELKKAIKKAFNAFDFSQDKKVFLYLVKLFNGEDVNIKDLIKYEDFIDYEMLSQIKNTDIINEKNVKKLIKKAIFDDSAEELLHIVNVDLFSYLITNHTLLFFEIPWRERVSIAELFKGKHMDIFLKHENDSDVYDAITKYFDPEKHNVKDFIGLCGSEGSKHLYKYDPAAIVTKLKAIGQTNILIEIDPNFILDDFIYNTVDDELIIPKKDFRKLIEKLNSNNGE